MNRIETFSGDCPNHQNHYINVNYIEVTSLDSPTTYIKGRFNCSKSNACKYTSQCPLYQNAPDTL